mmetsp:Transcript_9531/g.14341  ORF Transcript_9531/g.14341 Transcript_9531/m.14341 type:complete len:467 (-) Transcript_9531:234-1634(-)
MTTSASVLQEHSKLWRNSTRNIHDAMGMTCVGPQEDESTLPGDRDSPRRKSSDSGSSGSTLFGYRVILQRCKHTDAVEISTELISWCVSYLIKEIMVESCTRADHVGNTTTFRSPSLSPRSPKNIPLEQLHTAHRGPARHSAYNVFNPPRVRIRLSSGSVKRILSPRSPKVKLPEVTAVFEFVYKICIESDMEYECLVISLIYISRMVRYSEGTFVLNESSYKGVILACVLMASKVFDDFAMSNSSYCSIFYGLSVQRVNDLELSLLEVLGSNLWVSRSEYAEFHFSIQEQITRHTISHSSKRKLEHIPLSRGIKRTTSLPNVVVDVSVDRTATKLDSEKYMTSNVPQDEDNEECSGEGDIPALYYGKSPSLSPTGSRPSDSFNFDVSSLAGTAVHGDIARSVCSLSSGAGMSSPPSPSPKTSRIPSATDSQLPARRLVDTPCCMPLHSWLEFLRRKPEAEPCHSI